MYLEMIFTSQIYICSKPFKEINYANTYVFSVTQFSCWFQYKPNSVFNGWNFDVFDSVGHLIIMSGLIQTWHIAREGKKL